MMIREFLRANVSKSCPPVDPCSKMMATVGHVPLPEVSWQR